MISVRSTLPLTVLAAASIAAPICVAQEETHQELDRQVREFLDRNRRQWRDMNVPAVDGQKNLLHLVVHRLIGDAQPPNAAPHEGEVSLVHRPEVGR